MMGSLKGYRTYVVFVAYLLVALLANYGQAPTKEQQDVIANVIRLLNDPAVVAGIGAMLAFVMRTLTNTAPGRQI